MGFDLTQRDTHFEFGRNWADYSRLIGERRLASAIQSVKLLTGDLSGKSFLDIGSGSGLFSLAALELGVSDLLAVDLDENSVATTRSVLATHSDKRVPWRAQLTSVFDLNPNTLGQFDVVYSWGVLHHTGDMWRAISSAAAMVKPGGTFAFSLYQKTPLCGLWAKEKKFYMNASPRSQRFIQRIYSLGFYAGQLVKGRSGTASELPRGMEGQNDLHDWLGGFPYESTDQQAVRQFMSGLNFENVNERPVKVHAFGVFGSGCSEYVYRRTA